MVRLNEEMSFEDAVLAEPLADPAILPTWLLAREARKHVTAILSGEGADELFGGYETYVAQDRARTWRRLPVLFRGGLLEPLIRSLRPRPAKKGLINKAKRFVEGLEHDARLGHACRLHVRPLRRAGRAGCFPGNDE